MDRLHRTIATTFAAPVTVEQVFSVASDVEGYPAFLPWCKAARVVHASADSRDVENRFGAGPFLFSFHTRAEADPPERLEITSHDIPFRLFHLIWTFSPQADGCRASATYDIELRSGLLQRMASLAAPDMERRLLSAFRRRVMRPWSRNPAPGTTSIPSSEE